MDYHSCDNPFLCLFRVFSTSLPFIVFYNQNTGLCQYILTPSGERFNHRYGLTDRRIHCRILCIKFKKWKIAHLHVILI